MAQSSQPYDIAANSAWRWVERERLIREKLDAESKWLCTRHQFVATGGATDHAVTVERRSENGRTVIVKTLRGFMDKLREHESDAYWEVFKQRAHIPRIATFLHFGSEGTDLTRSAFRFKDYGPDLQDWFTLIGPPGLGPDCFVSGYPQIASPHSPFLKPEHILAIVRAVLEALSPFHQANFVHCDIKADNLCVGFTANNDSRSGSHLCGELNLDSLTVIDLGCALRPDRVTRRVFLSDEGSPLYIAAPHRKNYIWPYLLGASTESDARAAASKFANEGYHATLNTEALRQVRARVIPNPANIGYVSDHYLLAYEMATLGERSALQRLDWRVDFFSLGELVAHLLRNMEGRIFDDAPASVGTYLLSLPGVLKSFDGNLYNVGTQPLPHQAIISKINELIGEGNYRRIPFTVEHNANPFAWFQVVPDTIVEAVMDSDVITSTELVPAGVPTQIRSNVFAIDTSNTEVFSIPTKLCDKCRTRVTATCLICPSCGGRKFVSEDRLDEMSATESKEQTELIGDRAGAPTLLQQCSRCGCSVGGNVKICPACGSRSFVANVPVGQSGPMPLSVSRLPIVPADPKDTGKPGLLKPRVLQRVVKAGTRVRALPRLAKVGIVLLVVIFVTTILLAGNWFADQVAKNYPVDRERAEVAGVLDKIKASQSVSEFLCKRDFGYS